MILSHLWSILTLSLGSGPTCALNKIITGLNMERPPVVFVSRVDHHFKILPWVEISSEVNIFG